MCRIPGELQGWDFAHEQGFEEEQTSSPPPSRLAEIPGIESFDVPREVSPKNGFRFGLSMEFADQAAYDGYNEHPAHVAFVQERWPPEVTDFLEVDHTAV